MPRQSKGARLYLKPSELDKAGKVRKQSVWIIRDGSSVISTGCAPLDREGAETALADYIASKYKAPAEKNRPPASIAIPDVLKLYQDEKVPKLANPAAADSILLQLAEWWGEMTLADVTGRTCREYLEWRLAQPWKMARPEKTGKPARMMGMGGVRRELEMLRAAINYHRKEGYCREVVEVTLPKKAPPKDRWLTRSEVAQLVWTCWRYRDVQSVSRGPRKGERVVTARQSLRHLARFILVALYTGSRAGSICSAALTVREGSGFVDLDAGVFYRRKYGRAETNKRQPPVRLPPRLLAHMRRWATDRGDDTISKNYVVEWRGKPVRDVNKGFTSAVQKAGLGPEVTPHVLRHTAATWLMQAGCDMWDAAGYLGMTVQVLEKVYGHHHPDHQSGAVDAITAKPKKRV